MQSAGLFPQSGFRGGENALFKGRRQPQSQKLLRRRRELAQRRQGVLLKRQQRPNDVQHPSSLVGKDQAFGMA